MTIVNLKRKFRNGDYLTGSYDPSFQDNKLRETFQEQLNTKLETLKFDNVQDTWNNYRKIICEVADGVLKKKVRYTDRCISENALCLIERRRCFCKNCLNNRSYKNKKNTKEVEKALKCELRGVKCRSQIKLPRIWKMQLGGIIVKYCSGML